MKTAIWFIVPVSVLATVLSAADQAAVQRLFDSKLNPTLRANACFELRGSKDPDVISAMSRALDDSDLRACAADNLRIAGAIEALKLALSNPEAQVRAAAARELGDFRKPELLEPLSLAAQDDNLLVATNALAGLSMYDGKEVTPYLTAIAKKGGMIGDMALDRLAFLDPQTGLAVARGLLASPQVADKLYAMKVIGATGDASDVPALEKIAAENNETLATRGRGFGFMPPVNLGRSAEAAISAIAGRKK